VKIVPKQEFPKIGRMGGRVGREIDGWRIKGMKE
jgi:hypothetical protein